MRAQPHSPARAGLALGGTLVALLVLSLVVGPGDVELTTAVEILRARIVGQTPATTAAAEALVWDLRLPRSLLAALLGAALAAAGMVTQGLFRNPMAEPGVLGITPAAAAAAVLGFMLGLDALGPWATPAMAGLGAAACLMLLSALAARTSQLTTLLLSGIAIGALFGAATTLMLAVGTERWDLGLKVVRWLMGSFEARSWSHLGWAVGPCVVGLAACAWLRLDLDALQLGPETARSLGIDLARTRTAALVAVGLLVGTATATAGVIGFVGLVVPHLARRWVGAAHARLLPTSALGGAAGLLAVDVATRSMTGLAIPPGVVTALLGAPLFLWMLISSERGDG